MNGVNITGSDWVTEFGFTKNPYDTRSLSFEEGDKLLVGRDEEVNTLIGRLRSGSKIPMLLGENGVGKTSIVNVSAYRMSREYASGSERYLVLNPKEIWTSQLSDSQFEEKVYLKIAHLLLDNKNLLIERGIKRKEIKEVRNLLLKPTFTDMAGGFGGVSLDRSRTPNSSFENSLASLVKDWLNKCFSNPFSGGVVCVIDNLDTYGTSEQVKKAVEDLRDPLFGVCGLLWVLCGTSIAARKTLFSQHLQGRLAPQYIENVKTDDLSELIKKRLEYYSKYGQSNPAPVSEKGFEHIYKLMNSRLRSTISLCESFAEYLYQHPGRRTMDRFKQLNIWLEQKASELTNGQSGITNESWNLFDNITNLHIDANSAESEQFNIKTAKQLDETAKPLADKGLLNRTEMDNGDFILQVTDDGWLVHYKRTNYKVEE